MRFSIPMYDVTSDRTPRWASDLGRQLELRGSQAPAETLGPVTALEELAAAARAALAGAPMKSVDDRNSLRNDLRRAIDAIGGKASAVASVGIAALKADLGSIPDWLADSAGAARALAVAEVTTVALATPQVCGAAWDDLQRACEGDETAGHIELRILQLAELVEARGADWRSTAQRITHILADDIVTMADLGEVDATLDRPEAIQRPAGVAFDRRLSLAREASMASSPTGERVGWVCFANASLQATHKRVGDVGLFGHQMWPDGLIHGWAEPATASEFADEWHRLLFFSMPDEPYVLMRIPLGHGSIAGAVKRVRQIAADLVRAAQPASEWRLIDGAAIHVTGDGADAGWFGQPLQYQDASQPLRFSPEFEPTADRLAGMDETLLGKLLNNDQACHRAVRDIEWAENVLTVADDPQRLALSTRLIERALPAPEGKGWPEAVSRYCKAAWIERETLDFVADIALESVSMLDGAMAKSRPEQRWSQRLTPSTARSYGIDLSATLDAALELASALPDGSIQRRMAQELATHTSTPDAWLSFMGTAAAQFDVLLSRLVRQRNAVLHGADTVAGVIVSLLGFTDYLQSFLTAKQLRAAGRGETLAVALEANRLRLSGAHARLKAGESPATALFVDPELQVSGT